MTSKQRAYLKGLAMTMDPILQLGKGGLTPENTAAVEEALAARELIKISVLQNCLEDPREMAQVLAERTRSQVVTKKIGIMGGTFDPIHMGHLILGEKAYEQLELDKVLFMPCGNPPHKRNRKGRATDEQRAEMVRLAIEDNPHFELSLIEMHEEGYTYTYRTLEQLNKANPDTEYYFIIGADSLFNFDTWMEPERICHEAVLVVATRDHTPLKELDQQMQLLSQKYNGNFIRLDTMNIDVSSELLRSWHESGQSLRYYVPQPVISYIEKNDIYKGNDSDGKI